ncbi:MAG: glycogen/starch/alpha-glucan phosphorylase [Clostridia bacterium]|nr:glycogen/starch/alpha-glucan phosphorylase [Clostridia bacterium]
MKKFEEELQKLNADNKDAITLYREISELAMESLRERISPPAERNAYYLSIEYLLGRSFYNNLMELGVLDSTKRILAEKGIDINVFEEIEDAALGNGGLGRLAACFLDSAAALGLPLYGYGIRYKYGLFKQKLEDGRQIELPDDWQRYGDPWSVRRENEKRVVEFADFSVTAVPYDIPVIGKRVNTLRLFQAEGSDEAKKISEWLYPPDDTEEGKLLRLRQEYFFSAAAIGELTERHAARYGKNFDAFPQHNTLQLNDTHPVIAVAELIRLLTEKYGASFKNAVNIAKASFNYTNHTVLPEALECWNESLVKKILPKIADIIERLNKIQEKELKALGCTKEEIADMAIYRNGTFAMANLAVYMSSAVNGVAALHTEILKNGLFRNAYRVFPDKFRNKTNGVTKRRWLMLCNPELADLIDKTAGKGWRDADSDYSALIGKTDGITKEFTEVKSEKKRQLFNHIAKHEGITIPNGFLVYAQVKRLHEYKRQFMTAFAIYELYVMLKNKSITNFYPSVFIFGAKSAPSYRRAKAIIKFINEIASLVNNDPEVSDKLKVVFVQNYNVSYAEKIVPGTDVSLQVSTAGLEASGTGNMKFMMNGAVTCGTMDGANVEIVEHAGRENNYIFGATVQEIEALKNGGYNPNAVLAENELHRKAVESLVDGSFSDGGTGEFKELYNSLTVGASWHKPDQYYILNDLESYVNALLAINRDYAEGKVFARKQLENVARSSYFSSDRTIKEYAQDIWHI